MQPLVSNTHTHTELCILDFHQLFYGLVNSSIYQFLSFPTLFLVSVYILHPVFPTSPHGGVPSQERTLPWDKEESVVDSVNFPAQVHFSSFCHIAAPGNRAEASAQSFLLEVNSNTNSLFQAMGGC